MDGVRVLKYLAAHDSGRIVNPLTAASQVKGGATMGIGMALHEELIYDRARACRSTPGYYGARVMTHRDAPDVEVLFVETQDALRPVRRENARRAADHPVGGRGRQCLLQRHRTADQGPADVRASAILEVLA